MEVGEIAVQVIVINLKDTNTGTVDKK